MNDDGTRDRDRRHVGARPGPRDRVRDDRAGAARHPDGPGDGRAVRHRARAARHRARWARGRCRSAAARSTAASEEVLAKARQLAAHLLEANVDDIVLTDDGRLGVAGVPARALSWAELARRGEGPRPKLPAGHGARARARARLQPGRGDVPVRRAHRGRRGRHRDRRVELLRHVAVDDCGRILNPMLVAGQQHGGIAQGVAQALWEGVTYDDDGNPLTANLMDYAMPSAAEFPSFEASNTETPTPLNPLGAKGIGESGTIGSTPAVQNAVDRRAVAPRRPPHRHAARTASGCGGPIQDARARRVTARVRAAARCGSRSTQYRAHRRSLLRRPARRGVRAARRAR